MSTLHAPHDARLQLRLVPVSPSFTWITSHKVVRASYDALYGLLLTVNVAVSCVIPAGIASGDPAVWAEGCAGACAAARAPAPDATVVSAAALEPAALRKFRREYSTDLTLHRLLGVERGKRIMLAHGCGAVQLCCAQTFLDTANSGAIITAAY